MQNHECATKKQRTTADFKNIKKKSSDQTKQWEDETWILLIVWTVCKGTWLRSVSSWIQLTQKLQNATRMLLPTVWYKQIKDCKFFGNLSSHLFLSREIFPPYVLTNHNLKNILPNCFILFKFPFFPTRTTSTVCHNNT